MNFDSKETPILQEANGYQVTDTFIGATRLLDLLPGGLPNGANTAWVQAEVDAFYYSLSGATVLVPDPQIMVQSPTILKLTNIDQIRACVVMADGVRLFVQFFTGQVGIMQ